MNRYARGRMRPPRGAMNALERRYAAHLAVLRAAGEIQWCAYEPVKLRLADLTWYAPDFLVMAADGTLEAHEVKGFWEEDARVKIKVAAEVYPIRFIAVTWSKATNTWQIERFIDRENEE